MKIILFTLILTMIGMATTVNADTFEGIVNGNYLFLDIDGDKGIAHMRIDGEITSIKSNIHYYENGNIKIEDSKKDMRLFFNGYEATVLLFKDGMQKYNFTLNQLYTTPYEKTVEKELTPLEKYSQAQEQIGLIHIETQKRLAEEQRKIQEEKQRLAEERANYVPRSEYTESTDKEIEMIVRSDFHVPLMTEFNHGVRVIDPEINKYHQYYGGGYIGDVEITGKVMKYDDTTYRTIKGVTDKNGYYAGAGIYIPSNTPTPSKFEWLLILNATKYFDDTHTFATYDIVKSFFIIPNPDNSNRERLPVTHFVDIPVDVTSDCDMDDTCFIPSTLEIISKDTVLWTNYDTITHTITFTSLVLNEVLVDAEPEINLIFNGTGIFTNIPDKLLVFNNTIIDTQLEYDYMLDKEADYFETERVELFENTGFDEEIDSELEFTFDEPNEIEYICSIHPWMRGNISVYNE